MTITDGTAEFEIKELDYTRKENFNEKYEELKKADANNEISIEGVKGPLTLFSLLHRYGVNPNLNGLSNQQWSDKGIFISYFNENGMFEGQPSRWGQLINLPCDGHQEIAQIWIQQASGLIYSRAGNDEVAIKDVSFTVVGGRQG